jgi:hypothetical protein
MLGGNNVKKFRGICTMSLALALVAIASCGDPVKWTSSRTEATDPATIKLYTQTPRRYERLGTVTHLLALDAPTAEKTDGTTAFRDMLAEAGSMGADGLLLVDDTTMADASMDMTFQGKTYAVPIRQKSRTIIVQGIHVIDPNP